MKSLRFASPGLMALAYLLLPASLSIAQQQPELKVKVEVKLVDSETGRGIPYATLVAFDKRGNKAAVLSTNLEGAGTFEELTTGEYRFKALHFDYHVSDTVAEVQANGSFQSFSLALKPSPGFVCCGICCGCVSTGHGDDAEPLDDTKAKFVEPEDMSEGNSSGRLGELDDFSCYPNPTRGYVHVSVRAVEATQMILFSGSGQLLHTFDLKDAWEMHVNLNGFPAGFYYFVCAGNGKFSNAKKVIKED